MMRFDTQDGCPTIIAEVKNRYSVYLDNDSLIELAKGDPARRQRFVAAIRQGGVLLFSLANALEMGGPQGASAASVDSFLDSVGPHWAPLELNPWAVMKREAAGLHEQAPISETFGRAYFAQRAYDLSPNGQSLLNLSASFFLLSAVADWSRRSRNQMLQDLGSLYEEFKLQLANARTAYERDFTLRAMKPVPFDQSRPATYVTVNLLRMIVAEWKAYQFTRNDVVDFCHAVAGTSAATLSTLDKQWKHRIERLPAPNKLAKVFYRSELGQLVDLFQTLVNRLDP
jgi:hypothetical protein